MLMKHKMMFNTIFIVRHGYRSSWTTDPHTGETFSTIPSPTNIASDPALTAYGTVQARELASLSSVLTPPICRIYSSPFYRCLQTIEPLASKLEPDVPLICDRGVGEWYGLAHFNHPTPAALPLLRSFFPTVTECTSVIPSIHGESVSQLHDRCAFALHRIISDVDTSENHGSSEPRSIIICSHAASIIAMGRALTGYMPEDPNEVDFHTYTCSISKYVRRSEPEYDAASQADCLVWGEGHPIPILNWKEGKGVAGGWDCVLNAGTEHLANGGERDWHFSGDESFVVNSAAGVGESKISDDKGDALHNLGDFDRQDSDFPKVSKL